MTGARPTADTRVSEAAAGAVDKGGSDRRGSAVPVLDASHDFAHEVEGDSAWSESYYFNAYDPAVDAGLFTRIGVRPNEGTIDVGLSVWLPGDRIANVRAVREQTGHDRQRPRRRRRPLRAPRAHAPWRLTADAEAEVHDLGGDVTPGPRPARPPHDGPDVHVADPGHRHRRAGRTQRSDDSAASTASTVGKGHLEQSGTWAGTITLDGDTWRLDPATARGNRDKSWGPRRWGGPQMWRWFSINIPGEGDDVGTHFGGIRIGTPAGDLHRGWVWHDGEATSIRSWDVQHRARRRRRHPPGQPRRAPPTRPDATHELRGDILRVYGVPHRTGERRTVVNEGLARWTYEGRTGYGISEYLHQLDDDGRPLVPIE